MAIYIPEKIKVGFVERDDTFDGKLSYINYINKSKKWALEKSWEKWRDKNFEPVLLDNTPVTGFVIHKGHNRYSDFAGKTTMIRIYHPNGFEFEITPNNLCAVLTHSNTSAGFISQECILGWEGGGVILLPTNSDIYKDAKEITDGYKEKIQGNLNIGSSYHFNGDAETKHIYLGSYNLYKKSNSFQIDYEKRVKNHFFLRLYEDIFEEYNEAKHGESYTRESYNEFVQKQECLHRDIIVAQKSKVWREVQKEDESKYESYVEDLKDFEKNINQSKVKIYDFEDLNENEISKAVNYFIKLKITQNFNYLDKTSGHSKEFLEDVNTYQINKDEIDFIKNNLLLVNQEDKENKEVLIHLLSNEEVNSNRYKFWERESLKNIIGVLAYDKKVDWDIIRFYNPLKIEAEGRYLYNNGYIDRDVNNLNKKIEDLSRKSKIVNYFYSELIKKFAKEKIERKLNQYYYNQHNKFTYEYKITENEFDKKYDKAFFEILTSKDFQNILKSELKKLTYKNETIVKYYSI